jgi:tRNA A-37 threonylcarbamoyl transferase component Bud32
MNDLPQATTQLPPVEPPADVPEIQRGNWHDLPDDDPVVDYLTTNLWDQAEEPDAWEMARLSQTAYIYREATTAWAIVAKFYVLKSGSTPEKHAARELEDTQRVRALGLDAGAYRAIRPLALWRGVLFLEHIDGLTLEDVIAVRRSQPGKLARSLAFTGQFLAALHARGRQPDVEADFAASVAYAHKVVGQLARHGVLASYPIAREGLERLIDQQAARPGMNDFTPALTHGDATTTNFIFPAGDGVVVIDWERLDVTDPAADLGRLMAELTHSINQHGGSVNEAEPFVQEMTAAYREALPADWDTDALLERARFYRASSTLRIARNGWVSRLDRTALVAQAMALLA